MGFNKNKSRCMSQSRIYKRIPRGLLLSQVNKLPLNSSTLGTNVAGKKMRKGTMVSTSWKIKMDWCNVLKM